MIKAAVGSVLLIGVNLAVLAATSTLSPTIELLMPDEALDGTSTKHVLVGVATFPENSATKRHSHAGDEFATVMSGAIEITNDGEGGHVYRAGQSYHNHRGVIHIAKNVSDSISVVNFVMIIDKGAPPQVPAQ